MVRHSPATGGLVFENAIALTQLRTQTHGRTRGAHYPTSYILNTQCS